MDVTFHDHEVMFKGKPEQRIYVRIEGDDEFTVSDGLATDADKAAWPDEWADYKLGPAPDPVVAANERVDALEAENAALKERPGIMAEEIVALQAENEVLKAQLESKPKPKRGKKVDA